MPKIKLTLTAGGIDAAVKQLEEYADRVEKSSEKMVERLVKSGTENAKELASYLGAVDTGELVGSIVPEIDGNKGRVHSTAPYSAYVEMGTGVVGKGNQHPAMAYPGWVYDHNEHGEAGWHYPGRDGKIHWTKGMPSRPYMYNTSQMMREALPDIAKEALQDND